MSADVPVLRSLRAAYPTPTSIGWCKRLARRDFPHPDLDGVVPFHRDQLRHPGSQATGPPLARCECPSRGPLRRGARRQGLFRVDWRPIGPEPRRIGFADAREGEWGLTEQVEIPEEPMRWIACWVCCLPSASLNRFATVSFVPTAKPSRGGKPVLIPGEYHVLAPTTRGGQAAGRLSVGWHRTSHWWSLRGGGSRPIARALSPWRTLWSSSHLARGIFLSGEPWGWWPGPRLVGLVLHRCIWHQASAWRPWDCCPTDPALTGPWRGGRLHSSHWGSPHVRYRHTDERWMRQLSVDMVLNRLEEIPMTPRRLWLGSGSRNAGPCCNRRGMRRRPVLPIWMTVNSLRVMWDQKSGRWRLRVGKPGRWLSRSGRRCSGWFWPVIRCAPTKCSVREAA